jgi:hypothetical protein
MISSALAAASAGERQTLAPAASRSAVRTDEEVMAGLLQMARHGTAHGAGAEECDLHGCPEVWS